MHAVSLHLTLWIHQSTDNTAAATAAVAADVDNAGCGVWH